MHQGEQAGKNEGARRITKLTRSSEPVDEIVARTLIALAAEVARDCLQAIGWMNDASHAIHEPW